MFGEGGNKSAAACDKSASNVTTRANELFWPTVRNIAFTMAKLKGKDPICLPI